jgi:hypothetical protein
MGTDGDPLEQLRRALDRLVEVDPGALADGQAVVEIHRQLARLEAVATRSSAAFDRTGRWRADGARTPAAWLAARCSLPEATARRRVRRGRDLPHLPVAERAWLEGDIGSSAVEQLTRARTGTTADQLAADEPELVRYARRLHPRAFARLVGHWRMAADPDGVEDEGEALPAARRVHLSASFAGTWFLDGVLDPVGGEVVATALARVGDELFRADWAAARAEHGDAATADRLGRTPAQRRADAFVELCRRSMSVPAGPGPRPLFTVVLDRPSLGRVCELARSRTPVAPGALVPWPTSSGWSSTGRTGSSPWGPAVLHRGRPPGRRGAGRRVRPLLLRRACGGLRGRPRGALRRGRPHHRRQRPAGVRVPQPLPARSQPTRAERRRGRRGRAGAAVITPPARRREPPPARARGCCPLMKFVLTRTGKIPREV